MPIWIYVYCFSWLIYLCYSNYKDRQKWRNRKQYAHCQCGQVLSEWFLYEGVMWHPTWAKGCGWISPWESHKEYRENNGKSANHTRR